MQDTVSEDELKILLDSAALAKADPSKLKPLNPFTQTGPTAQSLQMAVSTLHPAMAAKWRNEAGQTVSLAAAAAKAGLTEMNKSVHEELSQLDADYITGAAEAAARREAEMLAGLEKGASQLQELREKQTAHFQRQAGSNSSGGQHTRDFYRRLGVQNAAQLKNMPTRRLTGK